MTTRKLKTLLIASILVLSNLSFALSAEDAPTIGKDEGLFKINLKLPAGTIADTDYYYFVIGARLADSNGSETYPFRKVTMEPGTTIATVYIPVKTAGKLGSAQAQISYEPHLLSGFISGYGTGSATTFSNKGYWYKVKTGEVCEINLVAIPGVKVSGMVNLPESARPEDQIQLKFLSQSDGFYDVSGATTIYLSGKKDQLFYNLNLPKDMQFNVSVSGVFGIFSKVIDNTVIGTAQLGKEGLVHNIQIKEPQVLTFADPYIDGLVRAAFNQPSGPLYDYMLSFLSELNLDGTKIHSLTDLSKLQLLSTLTITNCSNISPYLETIAKLKNLSILTISKTPLPDLSFLKKLPRLTQLTLDNNQLTDIKTIGELSSLEYLIITNNRITDHSPIGKLSNLTYLSITCSNYEDLSFLKNCSSLAGFFINSNWKITDYSFVKSLKALRGIRVENVSAYADLSVILNPNDQVRFRTDVGKMNDDNGPAALKRHIALNEKARQILAKIIKPGMADIEKELAIHDYIVSNTRYDSETFANPSKAGLSSPAYLATGCLLNGLAVCEGYAEAFNLLINSVGIESLVVRGSAFSADFKGAHAWNMVRLDGEYYMVDTTWDDPIGNDPATVYHNFFNVTSSQLKVNHNWDESFYPKCTATTCSYENIKGKPDPAAVIPEPDKTIEIVTKPIEPATITKPNGKTSFKAFQYPFVTVYAGPIVSQHSNYYQKEKTTSDFQIATYEVTQADWKALMGKNPSTKKGDTLPVENVSWLDCITYCNKLSQKERLKPYYTINTRKKTVTRNPKSSGYRLPTDLEWEYAATGGEKSRSMAYSGGEDGVVANSSASAIGGSNGGNELGICDMSGNVAEWCWDAETDLKDTISFPKESYSLTSTHLFRGGSYNSWLKNTGISYRVRSAVESKLVVKGLRLARNKN